MGFKRPPKHRVDAQAVFVSGCDPAWDHDRIAADLAELEDPADHPVCRYLAGKTRYDLDAEGVRDYLGDGYWAFTLKRIRTADRARLFDLLARGDRTRFLHECAVIGCAEVLNAGDFKIVMVGSQMSEATADELYCIEVGESCDQLPKPNLLYQLGGAAWEYSSELGPAEKKR